MSATEVQTNGGDLNLYTPPITSGTVTIAPTVQFDYGQLYYWHPWGFYQPPGEPLFCVGKAHVFECDHEPKCKCGKVRRVMPKATKGKK